MDHSTAYKSLLYEHEVLWARYEMRDQHLKKIGEKIYDDIGQVLSLVRIQLCQPSFDGGGLKENAAGSGDLVGKAIRGLRDMHRSFYPDTELREKGLVKTLEYELDIWGISNIKNPVTVEGTPHELINGTQLIVFRMLQEMFTFISETGNKKSIQVNIVYEAALVRFNIIYTGDAPRWAAPAEANPNAITRRSLPERAMLLEGDLSVTFLEARKTQITLTVPFKPPVYGQ